VKKSMLDRNITSYTEKNINSNRTVQYAMLVGTNRMMIVRRWRKIPAIRGKDGREEYPSG
jgi:hypothetical protein